MRDREDGQPRASARCCAQRVTPLASIFGSGFLIIVPILERTLGRLAVLGAIAVCALAWLIGIAVRHVVRPLSSRCSTTAASTRPPARLDRLGDWVIVVAYVISVALYVRIMAQYVVGYAGSDSALAERALASAAIAAIVADRGHSRIRRSRLARADGARAVLGRHDHPRRRVRSLRRRPGVRRRADPAAGAGHRLPRCVFWSSAES